jgi:hypothetical protein
VNPARSLRNDTTPPPGAILYTHLQDDPYVADVVKTARPDWGNVETYLPQGSYASTTAIEGLNPLSLLPSLSSLSVLSSLSSLSLLPSLSSLSLGTIGVSSTIASLSPLASLAAVRVAGLGAYAPLSADIKPAVVFIQEACKTTEAEILSLVYNQFQHGLKESPLSPFIHDIIWEAPADPLEGYEQYQIEDWDGFGAEPITASTLACARRLMQVIPTSLGYPDIAPAADGTIALEWIPDDATHKLDKLFLDIGPGEVWRAYWMLRTGQFGRLPQAGFSEASKTVLELLFNDLSA